MPVFDPAASRPARAESTFLRNVLGPAKPKTTFLRQASRDYRRRHRRASLTRALIVLSLIGIFFGSTVLMSA
jgi:hypothetical protein